MRIQNGESYDELLAAYGDDPGMKAGAENAETGYRIYDGSKSYEDNFKEAAMGLANVGDVSQPVGSDYGYYIIRYVGDSVERRPGGTGARQDPGDPHQRKGDRVLRRDL